MSLRIGETKDDINPSYYKKMKHFNHLLNLLDEFCKEFYVPKNDLIIFGTAVLARNAIKDVDILDVLIPDIQFKKLINKDIHFDILVRSCKATIKDTFNFINTKCSPCKFKVMNKDTVLIHGFKCISKETWVKMQLKDPDSKNRGYINHPRLIK